MGETLSIFNDATEQFMAACNTFLSNVDLIKMLQNTLNQENTYSSTIKTTSEFELKKFTHIIRRLSSEMNRFNTCEHRKF